MPMSIHASKLQHLSHCLENMMGTKPNPKHQRLIRQALSRIAGDTYGYCLECGMKIPERDLEHKPERPCCSNCESNE